MLLLLIFEEFKDFTYVMYDSYVQEVYWLDTIQQESIG